MKFTLENSQEKYHQKFDLKILKKSFAKKKISYFHCNETKFIKSKFKIDMKNINNKLWGNEITKNDLILEGVKINNMRILY